MSAVTSLGRRIAPSIPTSFVGFVSMLNSDLPTHQSRQQQVAGLGCTPIGCFKHADLLLNRGGLLRKEFHESLRRNVDRLRPLDEAAAYARCHGDRDESVRIVKLPPRRARYDLLATGEEIRRHFEQRIDAREVDPAVAPTAPSGA